MAPTHKKNYRGSLNVSVFPFFKLKNTELQNSWSQKYPLRKNVKAHSAKFTPNNTFSRKGALKLDVTIILS